MCVTAKMILQSGGGEVETEYRAMEESGTKRKFLLKYCCGLAQLCSPPQHVVEKE